MSLILWYDASIAKKVPGNKQRQMQQVANEDRHGSMINLKQDSMVFNLYEFNRLFAQQESSTNIITSDYNWFDIKL